jgi:2-polyprenyl-6-methoxyphenol hydroxylase-like FAD-dependent oxidoreductase
LASELAQATDPVAALHAYEAQRREATARVVLTNRSQPPDVINIRVEELSGDRPYRHIDDLISQDELRQLSDNYKKIAGFSIDAVKA